MSAVESLEIDPILGSCGYNLLPTNPEGNYNYSKPFEPGSFYPRYHLMIKARQNGANGHRMIEIITLHIDHAPHRVRRSSTIEIAQEAERILQQCYRQPPSMQVGDLGTALRRFVGKNRQNLPKDLQGKHLLVPPKRAEQKMRQQIEAELAELAA